MAGVADTAFRLICREFGAAYLTSEMASSKAICLSDKKTARLLSVTPGEHPFAAQIFGDSPEIMAEAAKRAAEFGPDVIDINMGCPAPKIACNGSGSALMKNPALAGRIVYAVSRAVEQPVTVKIRKGWDDGSVNAVEIAKIAEQNGAAAVTVHGRTRAQMYAPPVDLSVIAAVREAVRIPVIGNGDVGTPEQAKSMMEKTGCGLVMVGRGALGAPWIFRRIREFLETGRYEPAPSVEERMRIMLRHIRLMCEYKGQDVGMREARKHAAWYFKGLAGAAVLRGEAGALRTFGDLERLAEKASKAKDEI